MEEKKSIEIQTLERATWLDSVGIRACMSSWLHHPGICVNPKVRELRFSHTAPLYNSIITHDYNKIHAGLRCYSCISFEGTAPNEECKNGPLSMKNTVAGFPSSRWVSRGQCCGPPWDQIGDCILNPIECAEGYFTTTTRRTSTSSTTTTTMVPDVTTTTTTPPRPPSMSGFFANF